MFTDLIGFSNSRISFGVDTVFIDFTQLARGSWAFLDLISLLQPRHFQQRFRSSKRQSNPHFELDPERPPRGGLSA
ncbi:MAG: hypothetical protein ABI830_09910 [Pseudolabrys sp.]